MMMRLVTGLAGLACLALTLVWQAGADEKKEEGWVQLFNGKDLAGWKSHPKNPGEWKVEDGAIVGSGKASHLFSDRGDYENFQFRIEAMINEKGNSGQYFRTEFGPGFPKGYEAQININPKGDRVKTGSLYPAFDRSLPAEALDKIIIKEPLHKPDEWFTQEVIADGNQIIIKLNGKTTVKFVDEKKTYTKGHFAIQQHDPTSVIKVRKIEVRELPKSKE